MDKADALLAAARDLLADIKRNRGDISLDEADAIAYRIRETEGWLLASRRLMEQGGI